MKASSRVSQEKKEKTLQLIRHVGNLNLLDSETTIRVGSNSDAAATLWMLFELVGCVRVIFWIIEEGFGGDTSTSSGLLEIDKIG